MRTKRNRLTNEAFQAIAARFQLLADPSRLRILHTLADGERNVGEIITHTGLEQANVSKHLALLLKEGILSRRKEGLFAYYRIVDPTIFKLCTVVCKGLEKKNIRSSNMLDRYRNLELFGGRA